MTTEAGASPPAAPHRSTDFFVSYNRADRAWAEWIAWQLEEAGYATVIQAWDFGPGANFVLEMDRAAREAERTIAVLSPAYLNALYTRPEWAEAFRRDPTGALRLLVPVRVAQCETEGLLGPLIYIDLVDTEVEMAKDRLLAGVRHERAKPSHAPGFPGTGRKTLMEPPPPFPPTAVAVSSSEAAQSDRAAADFLAADDVLQSQITAKRLASLPPPLSAGSMLGADLSRLNRARATLARLADAAGQTQTESKNTHPYQHAKNDPTGPTEPEHFDVFLSHFHEDTEWVEHLAERLEDEHGFQVWLDKWVLIPGEEWQPALARGLDRARSYAVCLGARTPSGWFNQEVQRALNRQTNYPQFRVIPLLLPGSLDDQMPLFLELRTWVDFRNPDDLDDAFYLLSCGIRGVPPGRRVRNPSSPGLYDSIEDKLRKLRRLEEGKLIDSIVAQEGQRQLVEMLISRD